MYRFQSVTGLTKLSESFSLLFKPRRHHWPSFCSQRFFNKKISKNLEITDTISLQQAMNSLGLSGASMQLLLPGLKRYLRSSAIEGLGKRRMTQLIDTFGEKSLQMLVEKPNELLSLPNWSPKVIDSIINSFEAQKNKHLVMVFLFSHGLNKNAAESIYDMYGDTTIRQITKNPYKIVEDIEHIKFNTAYKLARSIGHELDSVDQIEANLTPVLDLIYDNDNSMGNCAMSRELCLTNMMKELAVTKTLANDIIMTAIEKGKLIESVIEDDTFLYLDKIYEAEEYVIEHLERLICAKQDKLPPVDQKQILLEISKTHGITFSTEQLNAIDLVMQEKVSCINGGPGVGKTTVLRVILRIADAQKQLVSLCTPGGRAANFLTKLTGYTATTIHRLLGPSAFSRFKKAQLKTDFLIVDGASMLDIIMLKKLLEGLPNKARVLIVGDADQIPSIGPGKVFNDLITSGNIPTATLTEVFRQKQGSHIIQNAHRVRKGKMLLSMAEHEKTDFRVIHSEETYSVLEHLQKLMQGYLMPESRFNTNGDVQVLVLSN